MTTTIQTLSDEVWKPVVDYEGICEVSNHGSVRSMDRVVNHSHGGQRRVHGRILEQSADVDGYLLVGLSDSGDQKTHRVHRLVLTAFSGKPSQDAVCMHLDNNP